MSGGLWWRLLVDVVCCVCLYVYCVLYVCVLYVYCVYVCVFVCVCVYVLKSFECQCRLVVRT